MKKTTVAVFVETVPIMNPPALQEQDGQLPELRRKRELSSDDRKRVVSMLLLSLTDGALLPKLKQGAITEAANFFSCALPNN